MFFTPNAPHRQLTSRMTQSNAFPFLVSFFVAAGIYATVLLLDSSMVMSVRRAWSRFRLQHGLSPSVVPTSVENREDGTSDGTSGSESKGSESQATGGSASTCFPKAASSQARQSTRSITRLKSISAFDGGVKLPPFDVAVQSKMLVGPASYRMQDLPW
jgi:hypothetical protein